MENSQVVPSARVPATNLPSGELERLAGAAALSKSCFPLGTHDTPRQFLVLHLECAFPRSCPVPLGIMGNVVRKIAWNRAATHLPSAAKDVSGNTSSSLGFKLVDTHVIL